MADGHPVGVKRLFSAASVAASIAAAEADGPAGVSPYRSRLTQLEAAVAGRKPSDKRSATVDPHYPPEELGSFLAATGGLQTDEADCLVGALALGSGAGIIGPPASTVSGDHVSCLGGNIVVCAPGVGPVVARGRWGRMLAQVASVRGSSPLTSYYTPAGRQRLVRGLQRCSDVPAFEPHRLRTGWIVDLLASGVPLDVVARLAGVSIGSLRRYLPLADPPAPDARVMPDPTPFQALRAEPAIEQAERPSVDAMLQSHQPRSAEVAAMWVTPEAAALRQLVVDRATTGSQAKNLLTAMFVLLEWALQQPGLPLLPETLLKETTLGRWATVQRRSGRSDASVDTYLSALRHLAKPPAKGNRGDSRDRPIPLPYPEEERAYLLAACNPSISTIPERLRLVLATHVHAQLGSGIGGNEARKVRGPDVQNEAAETYLWIEGASARRVVVQHEHAKALATLARAAGDRPLTGRTGNDQKRCRDAINEHLDVRFDPARLQASWVVDRFHEGASAHTLMHGTGLTLAALAPLLEQSTEPRPLADLVAWSACPPRPDIAG